MDKTQSAKIILRGDVIQDELIATTVINPGYLVKRVPTGVAVQDAAGADVSPLIALAFSDTGKDITDSYAIGDQTIVAYPSRGAQIQCKLAIGAAAIAIGDKIESVGDGTVQIAAGSSFIGIALQAVDNSAGTGEVFIQMEVF